MDKSKMEGRQLHQCPECGLHYENQEMTQQCEAWCREHKSCNLEYIKFAVESRQSNE